MVNTGVAECRGQNQDVVIEAEKAGEFRWDQGPVRDIVVAVPGEAFYRVCSKSVPILLDSMTATKISFASSFLTGTATNSWYTVVAGN